MRRTSDGFHPEPARARMSGLDVLRRFVVVRTADGTNAGYLAGELDFADGRGPLCAVYLTSRDALGGGFVLVPRADILSPELPPNVTD